MLVLTEEHSDVTWPTVRFSSVHSDLRNVARLNDPGCSAETTKKLN
jgi:hypothetical protein